MPQMAMRETFKLETRNRFTNVDCEIGIKIEGSELPNAAILGGALEECITKLQEHVKAAYTTVPAAVTPPVPAPVR